MYKKHILETQIHKFTPKHTSLSVDIIYERPLVQWFLTFSGSSPGTMLIEVFCPRKYFFLWSIVKVTDSFHDFLQIGS